MSVVTQPPVQRISFLDHVRAVDAPLERIRPTVITIYGEIIHETDDAVWIRSMRRTDTENVGGPYLLGWCIVKSTIILRTDLEEKVALGIPVRAPVGST